MQRATCLTLVLALLCVGCVDDSDAADQDTATGGDGDGTGGGSVTGVVRSASGDPISGAIVTPLGDLDADPATTDESGAFSLQLPGGTQEVRVEARGFVSGLERFAAPGTLDFELLATADFDAALSSIGRTQQPGFGIVRVVFRGGGGGESAAVAGTSDTPFAFVGDGAVESEVLPGGASSLFFTNIDPGFTGLTDVSSTDCASAFDTGYPVEVGAIVVVDLDC